MLKLSYNFKVVLTKKNVQLCLFFLLTSVKKNWGNTHAELETRIQNLRLNTWFHLNFFKKIKFLV